MPIRETWYHQVDLLYVFDEMKMIANEKRYSRTYIYLLDAPCAESVNNLHLIDAWSRKLLFCASLFKTFLCKYISWINKRAFGDLFQWTHWGLIVYIFKNLFSIFKMTIYLLKEYFLFESKKRMMYKKIGVIK